MGKEVVYGGLSVLFVSERSFEKKKKKIEKNEKPKQFI